MSASGCVDGETAEFWFHTSCYELARSTFEARTLSTSMKPFSSEINSSSGNFDAIARNAELGPKAGPGPNQLTFGAR